MKVSFCLVLLSIVLFGCNSNSDPKSSSEELNSSVGVVPVENKRSESIDTTAYVLLVKNYCDSVDRHLKNFLIKKEDVFGSSAEGGEITYYLDHADTLKISAVYYGETGQARHSFYLKNNDPVYLDQAITYYKLPISVKKTKIERVSRETFILKGLKIIKEIGIEKDSLTKHYSKKEAEISELYKEIRLAH